MIVDPSEIEIQLESVVLQDQEVLQERLVRWDLLEHAVELEHVVNKVARETLMVLVINDL